ncbi:DEAD/DEAH box helicase family protein [Actinomadura viridis]|uniref:Superfamily II DNA or RNA helicase n=1 Tax=Actinomadura viridis TaxID=58110 RepID=A0A931GQ39_9ACTN|nr:DEAD/DEAH box helicase family protein [Actinomadura viridis]MBG6088069.1 superfamily II DNA or RNA helicase [Actinomadura viridis]
MNDDRARWPGELRPYQAEALGRLDRAWAEGRSRAWVVLPPGTGKTLVGLEAARRLGRRTVVLVPNTAIQHQWVAHWRRCGGTAGTDRALRHPVTVLTYQSVAVFDPDAETDEEGRRTGRRGSLMRLLHDNGRALVAALHDAGPLTLVLDECHHLLDVWGRLLAEILDGLPDARVLGLTATPPESLTPGEAELVDALFGTPIPGASIPAMVRQGYLAPFAELAWLTTPTAVETAYVEGEAERFAELTAGLLEPGFTTTGLLEWLDARMIDRTAGEGGAVPWSRVEAAEPRIAAAALRFHHAGLLALPPGARPREEHRRAPTAEDWVALLNDYVVHCLLPSPDPKDAAALEAVRRALPAVGHQLTRRGIRASRSPVDRVLARSAAKTHAATEIAAAEAASLGARLRCLVLCDHERAGATLPARLRDVLDAEAGSAWLMLTGLAADPRTRALSPMLVTGRTVAADEETARAFVLKHHGRGLAVEPAGGGVALITGPWTSAAWVPLITAFFEAGRCQVLVGTRGLLGEGWDARGVNALIDLTTATTPTAVVQTRGRALRLDPSWPGKTANTWTVVCVTDRHPKGTADWDRFVRKHAGYLAAAPDGEIVAGVAHVDASFSPYAPPAAASFDRLNREMLARAEDRAATRAGWRLGTSFRDELVHTLRIRPARTTAVALAAPAAGLVPPGSVPSEGLATGRPPLPPLYVPRRAGVLAGTLLSSLFTTAAGVVTAAALGAMECLVLVATALALTAAVAVTLEVRGRRRAAASRRARERAVEEAATRLDALPEEPAVTGFAYAVADALKGTGLSRRGAEGVTVRPEPDGTYRFSLTDVDAATSRRFAVALDEVLGPMATPRYVVPRYVVRPRTGRERRERALLWCGGSARADGVVYHSVPSVFGQNLTRTNAFVNAWNTWVSAGTAVRASTPEGEGILATHRGEDPFEATTVLRVAWD